MASVIWISFPAPRSWFFRIWKYLRLQDVAAHDDEVRRSASAGRLLDHRPDTPKPVFLFALKADHTVGTRLFRRDLFHGDDVDLRVGIFFAKPVIDLDDLSKAALALGQYDHVGQEKRKRILANDVVGAPDSMAKAKRFLLAGEACRAWGWQIEFEIKQFFLLVTALQDFLQLELPVEMILDNALVAARHKNEVLDFTVPGLVGHVLNDGSVDDGQHFFRHGLGGRKKPRTEARDGKMALR